MCGFLAVLAAAPSSATAAASLTEVQRLAAARGAEALNVVNGASRYTWKQFDPESLSLLVVEPGRWAVLINHPKPPAGFEAADPIPRRKFEPEDPDRPPWSVHVTTQTAPWDDPPPRGSATLEGRPTAIVPFNASTLDRANTSGWPPTEAVIMHHTGALWRAHRSALEPDRPFDVMPWAYRAGEEDVALAVIEQRLLTAVGRMAYSEKTIDKYRQLMKTWLAVRKARLAANPPAVAMEEEMEWREGLARFNEVLPLITSEGPGSGVREELEAVDPFFDRIRNLLSLRVNTLNLPLMWYPADPVQALDQAGARGALLSWLLIPMATRWQESYFPPGGLAPPPFRALVEGVLYKDAPADPNMDAQLLAEARTEHGFDRLVAVLRSAWSAPPRELQAGRLLVLTLKGRPLRRYESGPPRWGWAGPGKVQVGGPLEVSFQGGHIRLREGGTALVAGADLPGQGVDQFTAALPWDAELESGGKRESLAAVRPGRPRRISGRIMGSGLEFSFQDAELRADPGRVVISWPGPSSSAAR